MLTITNKSPIILEVENTVGTFGDVKDVIKVNGASLTNVNALLDGDGYVIGVKCKVGDTVKLFSDVISGYFAFPTSGIESDEITVATDGNPKIVLMS